MAVLVDADAVAGGVAKGAGALVVVDLIRTVLALGTQVLGARKPFYIAPSASMSALSN